MVEGSGGDDGFVDPVQQWATDDASPSGMAVVGDTIFIANLRGAALLRAISDRRPGLRPDLFLGEFGRLRDVVRRPDGDLWLVTNNTDGRGDPRDGDDRLLRLAPPVL